ncbi:adenylate/guanylate cyclase domain-containing protein [Tamlana sp. 62-3]|uniref:Adenylate/guanylate cyclase domain-containing protein n=1 Tax=Neotamlana sargassicola TaxID=2883125 RepID=A0A9X1I4M8_9FLAO|nr:adenylate/guanylate cyclase domain-containing protein [Tamlana sargassicola]MCB4807722.1 adenylate/guanylate cyclase domain-containing protein [Tamlana sargassicola]
MTSQKINRIIKQIIPFGVIWLLFGIIFLVIEHAATKDFHYSTNGAIKLNFKIVLFALPAVTMVGFIIGLIELLFINNLFTKKSFFFKVIGKLILYALFLFVIICITYPIAASIELKTTVLSTEVWTKFLDFLNSITFFSTAFQMAVSLIFTLFYYEISEKVGANAFWNFIIGKYHKPKNELRVFMFLDMKSSTAIAEKIGHKQYFKFLKWYYNIISEGVIKYSGEIYQYVGDEMVVSWKVSLAKNNENCIKCFFKMKDDLLEQKQLFINEFKDFPKFKAGIHVGEVTTGEIGKIKKDIIFTGDTLNTTARIQSLCNDFSVDLLVSEPLLKILELGPEFSPKFIAHQKLRGKENPVKLYTITENTN